MCIKQLWWHINKSKIIFINLIYKYKYKKILFEKKEEEEEEDEEEK